ncbi:hypothetical protein ACS8MQ_08775 [Pseudomonas sp. MAHUQ-62]|uniref:hypothetical protein n=1 Tax=Pseudomonas sp. GCM10023245 TaxID=3252652 RepID=UPI003622E807
MQSNITRIIKGLEILQKYKKDAAIYGKPNATWLLESQEKEYLEISEDDKKTLNAYGWRQRQKTPYLWILATDHGLSEEIKTPNIFR